MNKNLIKVSSELIADGENSLQHIVDNDKETLFLSTVDGKYPKDIYFEFSESTVLERIDFFTNHPTNDDGKITKYEILYKNDSSAKEWRSAYISNTYSSKGIRIAKFEPILAKEICLRVHSSTNKKVALNNIEFYVREDLNEKLLGLFETINCDKIKDEHSLKDIRDFKLANSAYNFIGELCEVGKYIRLNGSIKSVKTIKVSSSERDISAETFFEELKSNKQLFIAPLKVFVQKQKDILLISDKAVDAYVINDFGKEIKYKKIRLGKGMNIVYSKDVSGELCLINNRVDAEIAVYNLEESMHFKIGHNKFSQIIKNKNYKDKFFVEGKNFNAYLSKNYIVDNFNESEFIQGIENLDTILEYIYFLMERTDVYSQNILFFKTIFLEGKELDIKPTFENTELGSYLSFANSPEKFFNKDIKNCINEDFCNLIGEMFINEEIVGNEIGEVLKFLLKQELNIRYLRTQPTVEDSILEIWSKIRLVYGTERLMPKIIRGLSEQSLNNLVLVASQVLERNISIYFKEVYKLTEETVEKCGKYPPIHIDINLINYENQREYHLEETRRFNEILKRD